MNIYETINAVMTDVGIVAKTDTNTHQNFKFRGIDTIINAIAPQLQKHGLAIMPTVITASSEQIVIGQNQTRMSVVRLHVSYTFTGLEGDSMTADVAAEAMDSGDKATAKAMSVAYRTVLLQVFALASGDSDADHESPGYSTQRTTAIAQTHPTTTASSETYDPWAGQTTTVAAEQVFDAWHCRHGERMEVRGEKNGKEFNGQGCRKDRNSGEQCPANWFVLNAAGTWVPKLESVK